MVQPTATLHESPDALAPEAADRHRAIVSLVEELEAVDWYDERVQACTDDELREILEHNRDEEKEHAAMLLEWLRKNDGPLDSHLKTFLFRSATPPGDEDASGHVDPSVGVAPSRRIVEAP